MSGNEADTENEATFFVDRAPQGRAACRKCKEKIAKQELRLAKLAPNMFSDGGDKMKQWHHVDCMFEVLLKQRLTTRRIEGPQDIGNWENISADDQNQILTKLDEFEKDMLQKHGDKFTPPKRLSPQKQQKPKTIVTPTSSKANTSSDYKDHKDNQFREFRRLCTDIANVSSYLEKTALVKELFEKGRDGDGFKGDIAQWCRLLLPAAHKRVFNLQNKQLVKLFSRIFGADVDDMMEHLEQGDISETIKEFFEQSQRIQPTKKSELTMDEVEDFLEDLSKETTEDRQIFLLKKIVKRCTANDLLTIIRLIKHDLRMNAGPKHILEGVHPDAYTAFQSTHDLNGVIARTTTKNIGTKISLMTPVLPMLAEACKTIEQAMKKCPNGMYSEIKYDGERVQLHKQAFPHGEDLILDSEILMIDTETGKPLPFGTLGVHKQNEIENANVCLFVFDCIYYNGEDLSQRPIKERKKILNDNMTEIKNHVMFSELKFINKPDDLAVMIAYTLRQGLEGLVLKDLNSIYEPGKRHWLKVKKDYLFDGSMADTADLVVLGAWFGTGKKGGMMSVFLMGCYDPRTKKWCTVTKVHTGHDDATLERLQTELEPNMIKISCDPNKVPNWLNVNKVMVPDFIARDPCKQPVWEITGAEFSQQGVHTADKISIRFPRVTKIRDDKNWETATSLPELRELVEKSKQHMDDTLFEKLQQYTSSKTFDISNIVTPNFDDVILEVNNDEYSKENLKASIKIKLEENAIKKDAKKRKLKNLLESPSKIIKTEFKQAPSQPFPDVFSNIKLFVSKSLSKIENKNTLLRYFVAYGGTICNKPQEAQYVVHGENEIDKLSKKYLPINTAVHVNTKWLMNSIFKKKIQQPRLYMVTLTS
ncbi:DNA ligase 3 [Chrysoperla carnea]|uniref:DNA ligase 3 n=1 Tax=Chrysoperla carnea TaxID=189513 RepID=UPI001D06A30B|nr:DNA ligase 3 [Chrysoperla carnea]